MVTAGVSNAMPHCTVASHTQLAAGWPHLSPRFGPWPAGRRRSGRPKSARQLPRAAVNQLARKRTAACPFATPSYAAGRPLDAQPIQLITIEFSCRPHSSPAAVAPPTANCKTQLRAAEAGCTAAHAHKGWSRSSTVAGQGGFKMSERAIMRGRGSPA